jgi:hypothetical protein
MIIVTQSVAAAWRGTAQPVAASNTMPQCLMEQG